MTLLTGCLILILTAGYAKLASMVMNRLLSFPQPKWMLTTVEVLQFLTIPLYMGLLIVGLCKDSSTTIMDWRMMNSASQSVRGLILLGIAGIISLIYASVVYLRHRPPPCEIAVDTRLVDFRSFEFDPPWQEFLIGQGPMRALAGLPGNEQFTLEVNTKIYQLPRLPREWDGVSIVHLADTHFLGAVSRHYFELVFEQAAALKPDLFLFTGDLLDDISRLEWLPQTFGRLKAPLGQYFVLGNHDSYQDSHRIRESLQQQGWVDISGRSLEIDSLTAGPPLIISGDESPWFGQHPESPLNSEGSFQILVSHTPDNITWARSQGYDLMLSGHTHGGQICLPILGPVYCPSFFGCRYASGVFWHEPTLLYVSRGISGREPIRYLCAPELTKLVLHPEAFR